MPEYTIKDSSRTKHADSFGQAVQVIRNWFPVDTWQGNAAATVDPDEATESGDDQADLWILQVYAEAVVDAVAYTDADSKHADSSAVVWWTTYLQSVEGFQLTVEQTS